MKLLPLALLLAGVACSHEVVWLGEEPPEVVRPEPRIPLTVAVVLGSFEETRVKGAGVVERFAGKLREAELFEAVMFPVPAGADPTWEIQLAGSDSAFEPNSNFWKSAIASALLPAVFFVHLENDYTLELEALLLRRREIVGSWAARAPIRHRYGPYANRLEMDAAGVERAVEGAAREILAAIAREAERLRSEGGR